MSGSGEQQRRRWRYYETQAGQCELDDFLDGLTDEDYASVIAEMKVVAAEGTRAARHLDGEIYEVRASGKDVIYRVLFATEGKRKQILLGLEAFAKKTQRTPQQQIDNAKARLRDWRERGARQRREQGRE